MELTTYLLILVIVIAIIYVLLYLLMHGLVDKEHRPLRPIAAGLTALVVGAILAGVLLPYVTYDQCTPFTINILQITILTCEQAQNLVVKIAAVAMLTVIGLLVLQALFTLT